MGDNRKLNAAQDKAVREAVEAFKKRAVATIEAMNEAQSQKPNWWEITRAIRELPTEPEGN